jgi:DNA (cytosine-5)-methyltransferase 1
VVDLFAGCGGLTLGVAEAARALGLGLDVRLAVDFDGPTVQVYRANLPEAQVRRASVEDIFDGHLREAATGTEATTRTALGPVDVLVGGPPCQGHSDLNNHTRRSDPRNALYTRMARAAEILSPTLVLIENVPTVQHDVRDVVQATVDSLRACGYQVVEAVIDISRLGAPQRRRRHIVFASLDTRIDVQAIISGVGDRCADHRIRSIRWAIGDLIRVKPAGIFDSASVPSPDNAARIAWLHRNDKYNLPNYRRPECHRSDHSYVSMYGRLKWDEPAQTVTTGFGSMGQGRYVHPSKPRTLTPHEAARLQMLPDFWTFSSVTKRGTLAQLIGNAVPPVLVSSLLEPALRRLELGAQIAFPVSSGGHQTPRQTRSGPSRSPSPLRPDVPRPSSPDARRRMLAVRQSGTAAEVAICAEVDRLGLPYAIDQSVPGARCRADLLFEDAGVVVMVDGCYWHSCPVHGTEAKSNAAWWKNKLEENRKRDDAADRRLHALGWLVLRFWEHEDPKNAAAAVAKVIGGRSKRTLLGEVHEELRIEPRINGSELKRRFPNGSRSRT